jgi:hypothetical protein
MSIFNQTALGILLERTKVLLNMNRIWYIVFKDEVLKRKMIDWIRIEQLYKQGVDEDNRLIGTYSQFTELMNPEKVAGTHYTLFDSGEFYRSMFITVGFGTLEIDADTTKMESEKWWNDNAIEKNKILGFNEEHKQKLVLEVQIRFQKAIKQVLYEY